MIKGIGIDIVEIKRVEAIVARQARFAKRVLTEKEHKIFAALAGGRQIEYLAGRFAAKEAFAKARGTGFGKNLSLQDIEILADELGKPTINTKLEQNEVIHISITHSKEYAVAQVIIEQN